MRRQVMFAVIAAILSSVTLVPIAAASSRAGALHLEKECSEYAGQAGGFCTFTASNIGAIEPGDRVVYIDAATPTGLDTDVRIVADRGNVAFGHCTLVFAALPGTCWFAGGTGTFKHFQAVASVSVDATGLWHWDGSYRFHRHC